MSEWILIEKEKPPQGKRLLVYSEMEGIFVAEYHHYDGWKPFDEEVYATVPEDIRNDMRRLNDCQRGNKPSDHWGCACEDSYWDLDHFTHWRELPEYPDKQ
jgi:hypothetical protein